MLYTIPITCYIQSLQNAKYNDDSLKYYVLENLYCRASSIDLHCNTHTYVYWVISGYLTG